MNKDSVLDSRISTDLVEIRRRRQCKLCSHKFTTYETIRNSEDFPRKTSISNLKEHAIKHILKNINGFSIDITDNQIIITNKEQENESN